MGSKLKVIVKIASVLVVVVVGPLLLAELWFRWVRPTPPAADEAVTAEDIFRGTMARVVQPRIDRGWSRPVNERPNIFSPPLDSYVNAGFDDLDRLRQIAEKTRLPAAQNWRVPNFLRNPEEDTLHNISSDALGFRSSPQKNLPKNLYRTSAKSADTFRIVALGSYPTFGHGVNDDETYPHMIEKIFNSTEWLKRWSKYACRNIRRVEVFNGGRQGATAIMGYARLTLDVEPLSPDLLIWDYGWIDSYLRSDAGSLEGLQQIRVRPLSKTVQRLRRKCRDSSWSSSELCRRFEREITAVDREQGLKGWAEANRRAAEWAKKRSLPIFFIRHQGVSIRADLYRPLHQPNQKSFLFDTSAAIDAAVMTESEIESFWSQPTWIDEAGYSRAQAKNHPSILLRTDAIQYNALGYRRITDFLNLEFQKVVESGELQPACQK